MDPAKWGSPTTHDLLRQIIQQICRILGSHSQMATAGVAHIPAALHQRSSPEAAICASISVGIPSRYSAAMKIVLNPPREASQARRTETDMKRSIGRGFPAIGKGVTGYSAASTTWKTMFEGSIARHLRNSATTNFWINFSIFQFFKIFFLSAPGARVGIDGVFFFVLIRSFSPFFFVLCQPSCFSPIGAWFVSPSIFLEIYFSLLVTSSEKMAVHHRFKGFLGYKWAISCYAVHFLHSIQAYYSYLTTLVAFFLLYRVRNLIFLYHDWFLLLRLSESPMCSLHSRNACKFGDSPFIQSYNIVTAMRTQGRILWDCTVRSLGIS